MKGSAMERFKRWVLGHLLLVVAAAICAVGLAAVALGLLWDQAQIGTYGEWMSGLGAAVAILIAVYALSLEAQRRREDDASVKKADARRVWFRVQPSGGGPATIFRVGVQNASDAPIHDLWISGYFHADKTEDRETSFRLFDHEQSTHGFGLSYSPHGPTKGREDTCLAEWGVGTLGPKELATTAFRSGESAHDGLVWAEWIDVWGVQRYGALDPMSGTADYGEGGFEEDTVRTRIKRTYDRRVGST
jgi:hypothetical protein